MRPSKIKVVKAKKTWILLPNFRAITWKGTVYCKKEKDVESINATDEIDSDLKSHETIHVRQAESTHDSWFRFYVRYVWDWICNLPLIFVNIHAPYKFTAMEMEAYLHEDDFTYAANGAVTQWKEFEELSLKTKYKMAKEYYKGIFKKTFSSFLKEQINKD